MIDLQIAVLLESSLMLLPFNDLTRRTDIHLHSSDLSTRIAKDLSFSFPASQKWEALKAVLHWASRPGERARALVLSHAASKDPNCRHIVEGSRCQSRVIHRDMQFLRGRRDLDIMFFGHDHSEIITLVESEYTGHLLLNSGHRMIFVSRS